MPLPLFVYGTLKKGFCNFEFNEGNRIAGEYETVGEYYLYVLGELSLPWLVKSPGHDTPVIGQLFEVSDDLLTKLDRFERVGEPAWLNRRIIQVRNTAPGESTTRSAFVYIGEPNAHETKTVHLGPIPEYTPEMDAKYGDA